MKQTGRSTKRFTRTAAALLAVFAVVGYLSVMGPSAVAQDPGQAPGNVAPGGPTLPPPPGAPQEAAPAAPAPGPDGPPPPPPPDGARDGRPMPPAGPDGPPPPEGAQRPGPVTPPACHAQGPGPRSGMGCHEGMRPPEDRFEGGKFAFRFEGPGGPQCPQGREQGFGRGRPPMPEGGPGDFDRPWGPPPREGFRGGPGDERPRFGRGPEGPDGPAFGGEFRGPGPRGMDPVRLFKEIDADGDGSISREEFLDFHANMSPAQGPGRGRGEGPAGPPQGDGPRGPRGGQFRGHGGPEQGGRMQGPGRDFQGPPMDGPGRGWGFQPRGEDGPR